MFEWLVIPVAYLLGSISSAVIVCRLMGLPDPRQEGSGNPGATNVMRIGGKKAAGITLAGDMLKGLIPMLLAHGMGASTSVLVLVGLAAFLGHLYPVFFAFQGGKGVATAFGVFLGLDWRVGLAVLATWLLVYKLGKISSLSALTAAVLAPLYVWLLLPAVQFTYAAAFISALLIWRHQSNIKRLLKGEET